MTCTECGTTDNVVPGSPLCFDCQMGAELGRLMDELGIEDVHLMVKMIHEGAFDQTITDRFNATYN
jgi:hypothetical protein